VDYNFDAVPEKYRMLGNQLGAAIPQDAPMDEIREGTLEVFRSLKRAAGVTDNLCEMGMSMDDLPLLAENALADACLLTNPKQPTVSEVMRIYEEAC